MSVAPTPSLHRRRPRFVSASYQRRLPDLLKRRFDATYDEMVSNDVMPFVAGQLAALAHPGANTIPRYLRERIGEARASQD